MTLHFLQKAILAKDFTPILSRWWAMAARVRKRGAVADVRVLADQLGTPASRRKTDLSETEFAALQRQVKACCTSPEHHAALDRAWKQYKGEDVPEEETGEQAEHAEPATSGFRLRGRSCLFTHNSSSFAEMGLEVLWPRVLAFVRALHS